MPQFELSPGVSMFYRDDDFTDPWRTHEAVLMLHGNAESSVAWNGWVPQMARHFRVVRPDMRGFGRSTPMPADYAWSMNGIIDDFLQLADYLGIPTFHLVSAKVGAAIAMRLAATHPERVRTLTVSGARVISGREALQGRAPEIRERIEREGREGVEWWARSTMTGRLGSSCPPEMLEGWIDLMSATEPSTLVGFAQAAPGFEVAEDLARIACPTLVIISEGKGPEWVAATRAKQDQIANSELLVLPGDSGHSAATDPEVCARAAIDFIERTGV